MSCLLSVLVVKYKLRQWLPLLAGAGWPGQINGKWTNRKSLSWVARSCSAATRATCNTSDGWESLVINLKWNAVMQNTAAAAAACIHPCKNIQFLLSAVAAAAGLHHTRLCSFSGQRSGVIATFILARGPRFWLELGIGSKLFDQPRFNQVVSTLGLQNHLWQSV